VQYRELFKIVGNYLFYFALVLCLPFLVALYFDFGVQSVYPNSYLQFLETIGICLLLAGSFRFLGRKAKGNLYRRESILLVVAIWFLTSIISALPFYLTRTLENPVDAYFESISGLTTTGASIMFPKSFNEKQEEIPIHLTNVHVPDKSYDFYGTINPIRNEEGQIILEGLEAVARPLLFWRSFMQWLGGLGIVLIFLTVLPALGVGGKFLYQMEMTGPLKESIAPRIKETASLLWKLYLGLTFIELILLELVNPKLPFYDAICLTLSNVSTGGFSINSNSIGHYNHSGIEWVVLLFMILGSINFGLYFHIIRLKFYRIYSPEFSLFAASLFLGGLLVSAFLFGSPLYYYADTSTTSFMETIRVGAFQAVSAQTSTGFSTANYDLWPFPSQMIMFILMYLGGMAGATCGGIKTTRFYILYKMILHKIEAIYRPDKVKLLKIGKVEIDDSTTITSMAFFAVAIFSSVFAGMVYILDGVDPETAIAAASSMLNNTGISFRAAGPTETFAFLSNFSKIISSFWMVLGRLEYFAIILLFLPVFWRSR